MSNPAADAAPVARASSASDYRRLVGRRIAIIGILAAALVLSFLFDLTTGPAQYALADVATAVIAPSSVDERLAAVIWQIRMPVALMAVLVGAALSVAGAQMQTILSNPLASPFTLGWPDPIGWSGFNLSS